MMKIEINSFYHRYNHAEMSTNEDLNMFHVFVKQNICMYGDMIYGDYRVPKHVYEKLYEEIPDNIKLIEKDGEHATISIFTTPSPDGYFYECVMLSRACVDLFSPVSLLQIGVYLCDDARKVRQIIGDTVQRAQVAEIREIIGDQQWLDTTIPPHIIDNCKGDPYANDYAIVYRFVSQNVIPTPILSDDSNPYKIIDMKNVTGLYKHTRKTTFTLTLEMCNFYWRKGGTKYIMYNTAGVDCIVGFYTCLSMVPSLKQITYDNMLKTNKEYMIPWNVKKEPKQKYETIYQNINGEKCYSTRTM